jgi:hypothetical protein
MQETNSLGSIFEVDCCKKTQLIHSNVAYLHIAIFAVNLFTQEEGLNRKDREERKEVNLFYSLDLGKLLMPSRLKNFLSFTIGD